MRAAARPRYLKATAWTAVAVALIPAVLLTLAYIDFQSPQWDPKSDSGAVQGFMIIFLAAAVAVMYVVVAFPAAARILYKRGRLGPGAFSKLLAVWLAATSMVVGGAVSLLLGDLGGWIPLALIMFVMAAVLTMPFMYLWLRLSQ